MEKPYEITEEAWLHFIMANKGRSEEDMEIAVHNLYLEIAQMEYQYYLSLGGRLH